MTRKESKDRIAWFNGYTMWNAKQILFEQGPIGYFKLLKEANKLYRVAQYYYL